ncbi:hypothetical protein RJT34_05663 [Clitoria ternatea]|uniref:BTB/POZ domain-containing protein n=1 Tax=Clitoria ternatea TaxID=43366 RepID=A0AAN9K3B2_CLITE
MRNWNQFGVIETIYEEEREFSSTSSSPPSLHSIVNAWSLDSGCETDVSILVQGTSFRLHKDRLISRSSYLKRHLTAVSNVTLSPPLNITAETFAALAEFCYCRRVQLTAGNVVAVRTAAELLGMTGEENLRDVAEAYFERLVVGVDAPLVLRSCVALLPDSETTASLASRCIEAMVWEVNDVDDGFLDVVLEIRPRDFVTVAYSLNRRLPNHDVLYKMVDLYLKENKYEKVTEEQRSEICNSIDCTKVSPHTLVDCVQNPRMPLRFIVRAILVEHLNTRRSVAAAATTCGPQVERTSLREFLQRDTAHRQRAQLKEAMDSTYSRIQSLEKELRGMKKILMDHHADESHILNSERSLSASFHYVPTAAAAAPLESSQIQRGGRGSVSSSGFLLDNNNNIQLGRYDLSLRSCHDERRDTQKMSRGFGHRFITGLKNAFRISNN